jgi:hypothetical protein
MRLARNTFLRSRSPAVAEDTRTGQIDDDVDGLGAWQFTHAGNAFHAAIEHPCRFFRIAAQDPYMVTIRKQCTHQQLADKAGGAGDQDGFRTIAEMNG